MVFHRRADAGSTLVVPPLEEVFYRSFLYRYIVKPDFDSVPMDASRLAFLGTSVFLGFSIRNGWRESCAGLRSRGWCAGRGGWATR